MAGKLFVVGTPLGNRGDLSERARETLLAVDGVLCEDTRVTAKLLAGWGEGVSLERADAHVLENPTATRRIVERLGRGERLAYVTDAGMPTISDPGGVLVDAALDAGVEVEVIPGPSAVSCAIAASGLACPRFFFQGFLARKGGERRRQLELLASLPAASIVYESPHRAVRTISDLGELLPERRVALCRELTKVHREVLRGTAGEVLGELAAREKAGRELKGECVIVVEAPTEGDGGVGAQLSEDELRDRARSLIAEGFAPSAAAKALAKEAGIRRKDAYSLVVGLGGE